MILACAAQVTEDDCDEKTGNCFYDRGTDPLDDCTPLKQYILNYSTCDPYVEWGP